ncbi:hypothetical protein CYMTET_26869 [Cymbomonas tetramitiformis]|uniref:Transmembrane protein n=1 Tax=Cymbomonas tetramitiformis TaxID=36881 RepID=A0AAE0FRJ7_9CHLO|nr:hypothetical protein CYMTET_26869 [Cymbomonas tetramitiformis]
MSEKRQQPTTSLLESLRGYERHAVLGLLFLGVTLLFLAFPFSTTNLFNESCGADCMAHKRQLLQDELNVEVTPAARPLTIEEKVERWPSKESWPTEAEMAIPVERTKVQDHHLPDGGSGSEERDVPTAGRFRGKREAPSFEERALTSKRAQVHAAFLAKRDQQKQGKKARSLPDMLARALPESSAADTLSEYASQPQTEGGSKMVFDLEDARRIQGAGAQPSATVEEAVNEAAPSRNLWEKPAHATCAPRPV